MAGDHKCPVCASTFTRPQHVARHMRSHTGDRPYKCTHCGDQFARSDLLSRHVNKCHASEKPPTTTQPARRKGHAQPGSSSQGGVRGPAPSLIPPPGARKTCDLCAASRTPAQCDSGLPCGKCLQRNTKCTYVKANEARRASGPTSASVPLQRPHDLFSTPGAPLTVPSMSAPGSAPGSFPSQPAFNFTVPLYPHALDPAFAQAFDASAHPQPPAGTTESVESSSVYNTTQFLRNGVQNQLGHAPSSAQAFTDQALAMPPHMAAPAAGQQYVEGRNKTLDAFLNQSYTSGELPNFLYPPTAAPSVDSNLLPHPNAQTYGFDPADLYYDARAHDQPAVGSDFAFSHAPAFTTGLTPRHESAHALAGPGLPPQPDGRHVPNGLAPQAGEFSSAFGLMSLDDPAVAAEMSRGASFFAPGALDTSAKKGPREPSVHAHDTALPPATPGSVAVPGRDANIAELRDFWKAFMRDHTPGEKTANVFNGNGSASIMNGGGGDRPGMRRSLSKMTSMPDIKTPPVDAGPHYSTAEEVARHAHAHGQREDLRSYEQAVLARQAPSLTLVAPRKRATFPTNQHPHPHPQPGYPPAHHHPSPNATYPPSQHQSPSFSGTSSSTASPQPLQPQEEVRERPSFKRLASQTLGPFESKSVKVSHRDGAAADAIAAYESSGVDAPPVAQYEGGGRPQHAAGGSRRHDAGGSRQHDAGGGRQHDGGARHPRHHARSPSGEYPPALHERDRRLSAPSASATRPAFAPE